jgi:hypothetical protein
LSFCKTPLYLLLLLFYTSRVEKERTNFVWATTQHRSQRTDGQESTLARTKESLTHVRTKLTKTSSGSSSSNSNSSGPCVCRTQKKKFFNLPLDSRESNEIRSSTTNQHTHTHTNWEREREDAQVYIWRVSRLWSSMYVCSKKRRNNKNGEAKIPVTWLPIKREAHHTHHTLGGTTIGTIGTKTQEGELMWAHYLPTQLNWFTQRHFEWEPGPYAKEVVSCCFFLKKRLGTNSCPFLSLLVRLAIIEAPVFVLTSPLKFLRKVLASF